MEDRDHPHGLGPQDHRLRRTAEGLSKPEIIRCLKRYVARETYLVLKPAVAD